MLTRGIFLDTLTVDRGDLDWSAFRAALPEWTLHELQTDAARAPGFAQAEVVVTNKVRLDAAAMDAAPGLRLIALTATGTNNVDLEAARARGITVCNIRNYATPAVAQHVWAMVLALTTRLEQYSGAVRAGRWSQSSIFCLLDWPIRELAGRTLGIVGHGALGQGTAAIGAAFGMRVLLAERRGAAPRAGRTDFDAVLRDSDVLSLHCPLTPETQGLIGAAELARMKPDAVLINTARGAIVEARALADALRAGRLGGAGIDVLDVEPPPADHPLLAPDIPNLIVTPHSSWASREARQRGLDAVAANIRAYLAGAPQNVV